MRKNLTSKQKIILKLIMWSWINHGLSPTRKELAQGFEKILKVKFQYSRQAIDRHLFALEKKRYIIIDRKKGRRNIKIKS